MYAECDPMPNVSHILCFSVTTKQHGDKRRRVGDEFDSFECLKLKVEEIECISNCTFVTESSNTVENGGIKTDVCAQETRK